MDRKALRRSQAAAAMQKREAGFSLAIRNERLPEYNALRDRNLQLFFQNRKVQARLQASGLIDNAGRVVDLDQNKSKLFIIEQEFKAAERAEKWRRKEEEEMRHRVQQKRFETLDKARRADRLAKIKEDRAIRQQIQQVSRSALSIPAPNVPRQPRKLSGGKKAKRAKGKGGKKSKAKSKMTAAASSDLQEGTVDSEGSFFVTTFADNQAEAQ